MCSWFNKPYGARDIWVYSNVSFNLELDGNYSFVSFLGWSHYPHYLSIDVLQHAPDLLQVSHREELRLSDGFVHLLQEVLLKVAHCHWIQSIQTQVMVLMACWIERINLWVFEQVQQGSLLSAASSNLLQQTLLNLILEMIQYLPALGDALVILLLHLLEYFIGRGNLLEFLELLSQLTILRFELL